MDTPANIELPFFAYGIFKPRQIGFFQIRQFVDTIIDPAHVDGSLLLRDGLPIIDENGSGGVEGALLLFANRTAAESAYARIGAIEPENQYRWGTCRVEHLTANVLCGRSPRKGTVPCGGNDWDGWNDPLFTAALDVIEETLCNSGKFEWNLKPLFKLQMAYLLLWSAIERYVSLRYHLGTNVTDKVNQLAQEPAFHAELMRCVTEGRSVYRADRPGDKQRLDPSNPRKSLDYYYQIRSNITHRGKAAIQDHDRIERSLSELLQIFRAVLSAARADAEANHQLQAPFIP